MFREKEGGCKEQRELIKVYECSGRKLRER
jgi:hypothetical protein